MSGILTYSGIVTKARAMESHLLSREDYEKISLMESVTDLLSFLKEKEGYKTLFEGKEENAFHRSEIEEILIHSIYEDYAKLYRFADKEQRSILEIYLWRIEADLLKECIHRIAGERPLYLVPAIANSLQTHSGVDTEALKQATTLTDFADALRGSDYGKIFRDMEDMENASLDEMGGKLDIYCFTRIWNAIQSDFKGKNKKALMDVYGRQIDLLNLMWIYRTKRYYSDTRIKKEPNIIPVCYRIKKTQLQALVNSLSVEEFLHILKKTCYAGIGDGYEIEGFYNKSIDRAYRESQNKYPYSMSPVYGFLYRKRREIDRLTTALECIRYKLEPGETLQYILQG